MSDHKSKIQDSGPDWWKCTVYLYLSRHSCLVILNTYDCPIVRLFKDLLSHGHKLFKSVKGLNLSMWRSKKAESSHLLNKIVINISINLRSCTCAKEVKRSSLRCITTKAVTCIDVCWILNTSTEWCCRCVARLFLICCACFVGSFH